MVTGGYFFFINPKLLRREERKICKKKCFYFRLLQNRNDIFLDTKYSLTHSRVTLRSISIPYAFFSLSLSLSLSISFSLYLSLILSFSLSNSLSIYLSLNISLSLSLPLTLPLSNFFYRFRPCLFINKYGLTILQEPQQ